TRQPVVNADATLSWFGAVSTKLETRLARWLSVRAPYASVDIATIRVGAPHSGCSATNRTAHSTSGENAKWWATLSRAGTTSGEWLVSSSATAAAVRASGFSERTSALVRPRTSEA